MKVNKHHILWTRREHQQNRVNSQLRDQLVIPMSIGSHALLHEEVMPPLVPPVDMAREMLAVVSEEDYSPAERLGKAIIYLYQTGSDQRNLFHRPAQMLYANFIEQSRYME